MDPFWGQNASHYAKADAASHQAAVSWRAHVALQALFAQQSKWPSSRPQCRLDGVYMHGLVCRPSVLLARFAASGSFAGW